MRTITVWSQTGLQTTQRKIKMMTLTIWSQEGRQMSLSRNVKE